MADPPRAALRGSTATWTASSCSARRFLLSPFSSESCAGPCSTAPRGARSPWPRCTWRSLPRSMAAGRQACARSCEGFFPAGSRLRDAHAAACARRTLDRRIVGPGGRSSSTGRAAASQRSCARRDCCCSWRRRVDAGVWSVGSATRRCWNGFFLSCVLIAWAGLVSSRIAERRPAAPAKTDVNIPWARVLFIWGLAWWLLGGLHEIAGHVRREDVQSAALLFLPPPALSASFFWGRGWSLARFPALALAPLMAIILALQVGERTESHLLAGLGAAGVAGGDPLSFPHTEAARGRIPARPVVRAHPRPVGARGRWHVGGAMAAGAAPRPGPAAGRLGCRCSSLHCLPVSAVRGSLARRSAIRNAYLWRGAKPLVALLARGWSMPTLPSYGPVRPRKLRSAAEPARYHARRRVRRAGSLVARGARIGHRRAP